MIGARDRRRRRREAVTPDVIEVDLNTVRTPMELHVLLWNRLQFPSYYGRNWDAFWDCITDPDQSSMPHVLRLRGWGILRNRLPKDARLLRETLERLPSLRTDISVEWID